MSRTKSSWYEVANVTPLSTNFSRCLHRAQMAPDGLRSPQAMHWGSAAGILSRHRAQRNVSGVSHPRQKEGNKSSSTKSLQVWIMCRAGMDGE